MMAKYNISSECNGEICYTNGQSSFPTMEAYSSGNYSSKMADDMALAFVEGYLDVIGLLGKVKP